MTVLPLFYAQGTLEFYHLSISSTLEEILAQKSPSMAPPPASPLRIPQIEMERDFHENEILIDTVNAPCTGLSGEALAKWLREERKSHLQLVQAAWSISLRSYIGSDDVWFRSLGSNRYVVLYISLSHWVCCD